MSDRHGADSPFKDRKRSAHWSDDDTTVLLNHLLAHKDSGRTADNGFKPEIWRDAAALFTGPPGYRRNRQSSTATDGHAEALAPAARTTLSGNMGGPKTPEACKSRWQRLQRDYRAVREMEDVQGFEFDRSAWKLKASAEDWGKAENVSAVQNPGVCSSVCVCAQTMCVATNTPPCGVTAGQMLCRQERTGWGSAVCKSHGAGQDLDPSLAAYTLSQGQREGGGT